MIATTSDVVQTAIRAYAGDENAIKNFDLGGFLVTVYRLITDTKYILKIKEEFIFNFSFISFCLKETQKDESFYTTASLVYRNIIIT